MKYVLVLGLVLSWGLSIGQNYEWARTFGGPSLERVQGTAVDSEGSVYLTGSFIDSVDFNPGIEDSVVYFMGNADSYLVKFNSNGDFEWVRTILGSQGNLGQSVSVDNQDNVYYGGYFRGTVYYQVGNDVDSLVSDNSISVTTGSYDVFLQKLDSDGNVQWTKSLAGGGSEWLHDIEVDDSGNVYSTGYFQEGADFDPGVDTYSLSSPGLASAFISKLDTDGNFVWAKSFEAGANGSSNGRSICSGGNGSITVVGDFGDTVDFDTGPGVLQFVNDLPNPGFDEDSYVANLDSDGNLNWVKVFNQFVFWDGSHVAMDGASNIVCTGYFEETIDLDPGPAIVNATAAGNRDIFILKLDQNGNYLWSKLLSGTSSEEPVAVHIDSYDDIYIGGGFKGTVDFDPGLGVQSLTNPENVFRGFLLKLSASGDFQWVIPFEGFSGAGSFVRGVETNASGSGVYSVGNFDGTVDFDPGPLPDYQQSEGFRSVFVQKLSQPITSVENQESENLEIWPNPSTGMVVVQSENVLGYSVYDTRGKLVRSTNEFFAGQFHIDLNGLKKGIYIAHFYNESGSVVKKVSLIGN